MNAKLREVEQGERSSSLRRHQAQCSVCQHPQSQEIEEAWTHWGSTTLLARDYGVSREAIYRHMGALDLFKERAKRRRFLLEKVLEHADTTVFTGGNILKAFELYMDSEREEERQASDLASQEVSSPMADLEPAELAKDESLPEGGTSDISAGETGAAAVGDQQGEQGATPMPSQDAQNVEPTPTITWQ